MSSNTKLLLWQIGTARAGGGVCATTGVDIKGCEAPAAIAHLVLSATVGTSALDGGAAASKLQATVRVVRTGVGLVNRSSTGQCASTAACSSAYRCGASGPLT